MLVSPLSKYLVSFWWAFYISLACNFTSKQKNILLRNHGLEIRTNQIFQFLIHADYVLYHDYDKIIIINEDDFDHDEKGLRGW